MGKNFDLRPYSINDFLGWNDREELVLSPKFQRRRVWSEKAKSYLIDTIIRGLPIPPIFIREKIDLDTRKSIREVIDGQQRLAAILDFVNNGFKISKVHNEEFGGLYFDGLSDSVKSDFLQYEIATNLVLTPGDEQVLAIFARLNTYTVPLNKQELWNAKYFGLFKQTVHNLAYEFHTFWINSKILSENNIARMADVDLTSDLVIASMDGIHDKKVIESYYKKYDDDFKDKEIIKSQYKNCMDTIGEIYGKSLPDSHFSSVPLFYTLYCDIYDLLFGMKASPYPKMKTIKTNDYPKIRNALENLETILEEDSNNPNISDDIKQFIEDYNRHTTDVDRRRRRHTFLLNFILSTFGK